MSQQRRVFVYCIASEDERALQEPTQIKIVKWKPSLTQFIPPNTSLRYLFCWIAHYFRSFKNRDYCAFVIYKQDQPVCSLICVPAFYRWTFMKHDDLQIKNVLTHKEYRGQGLASSLVKQTIQKMSKDGRKFWYMTHENNIPSQKLCEKVGFKFMGDYKRTRQKLFYYQGEVIKK